MVQQLAAKVAFDRIGQSFGARGDQLVRDALRIKDVCPNTTDNTAKVATATMAPRVGNGLITAAIHYYISPNGADSNDGSSAKPFLSPTRARNAIRSARKRRAVASPSMAPAVVSVLGGHYFLGTLGALELSAEDSFTSWVRSGSAPFFSGAVELANLSWAPVSSGSKILQASLPPSATPSGGGDGSGRKRSYVHSPTSPTARFETLFDGRSGKRLVRARTGAGNGGRWLDPETSSGLCFKNGHGDLEGCDGYIDNAGGVGSFQGTVVKNVSFNTTRGGQVNGDDVYRAYDVIFEAPPDNLAKEGYPVAVCNQGEGGGELYNRAAGVKWDASSGDKYLSKAGTWAHPEEAVVHMMHNGWGNVQYSVASIDAEERTLHFERGGYQHGRGGSTSNFYVENQLELLDSSGEWYTDWPNRTLFLWPNTTAASAPSCPEA